MDLFFRGFRVPWISHNILAVTCAAACMEVFEARRSTMSMEIGTIERLDEIVLGDIFHACEAFVVYFGRGAECFRKGGKNSEVVEPDFIGAFKDGMVVF